MQNTVFGVWKRGSSFPNWEIFFFRDAFPKMPIKVLLQRADDEQLTKSRSTERAQSAQNSKVEIFCEQEIMRNARDFCCCQGYTCVWTGCTRKYSTAGNLRSHQRVHTGEFRFSPFCDFDVRFIDVARFRCEALNCRKAFLSSYALRVHTRQGRNWTWKHEMTKIKW